MIRIAIADDQMLLREMLSAVLSQDPDIEITGQAENGYEILQRCREKQPDMVLLDIKMPSYDGIYALCRLKQELPAVKAVMLTTFGDEKNVWEAYRHGADGYILKDIRPQLLIMTIKCIYDGLFVMHDSIHAIIRKQARMPSSQIAARIDEMEQLYDEYGLDRIDRKVIKLIIDGKNNGEIAKVLNFSEGTIKNRVSRILSVTGLKDRTQIAVFALKNNLV